MIRILDILKEMGIEKGAFHGFGMKPQDMRVDTCNIEWTSPDQDTGCPAFSDSTSITKEDIEKAITYLNEENLKTLIAYSRGGAVLLQALSMGAKKPDTVYLVAPAWNRQWPTVSLTGSEISGNGAIIHGGSDNIVPLKHSVLLAKNSGMPLYIFPGLNHINILKNKDNPTSGTPLKDLNGALDVLPDWGKSGKATDEQLKTQEEFVSTL
jgi:alpha-beta hydrolase superfamily lysophospholipase